MLTHFNIDYKGQIDLYIRIRKRLLYNSRLKVIIKRVLDEKW